MIAALFQIAGLVCLALAAFLVAVPLGIAATGAALVLVGILIEREVQ